MQAEWPDYILRQLAWMNKTLSENPLCNAQNVSPKTSNSSMSLPKSTNVSSAVSTSGKTS